MVVRLGSIQGLTSFVCFGWVLVINVIRMHQNEVDTQKPPPVAAGV